jgi:hypothetical protein
MLPPIATAEAGWAFARLCSIGSNMYQSVYNSILRIETGQKCPNKSGITSLIKQPCGMRNQIGRLEQPRFFHCCEVRDVSKIVNGTPLRALLVKTTHPYLGACVKPSLRENDQSALWIVTILKLAL